MLDVFWIIKLTIMSMKYKKGDIIIVRDNGDAFHHLKDGSKATITSVSEEWGSFSVTGIHNKSEDQLNQLIREEHIDGGASMDIDLF